MSKFDEMHKDDNRMVKICSECGKIMSIFEANVCGKCKSPIRQMHEQLERLCERMNVAEKIMATGYIYPKTLPDDAVIVIRTEGELSAMGADVIKQGINRVWSGHKVLILHGGLNMEIIEGSKDKGPDLRTMADMDGKDGCNEQT